MLGSDNYVAEDSIITLAAPSLEGKTQAAFTLRQVKPLYFPLSEVFESSKHVSQPIYINFRAHARALYACADIDLGVIRAQKNVLTFSADSYDNIGLWTVGFLMSLVDPSIDSKSWMDRFAKKESFEFERKKISDVSLGYFAGYCLYLDEFSEEPWSVYIRNLARVIGLRCICSKTNSRIANFVGKNAATGTGYGGMKIWSIVIVRLNTPNEKILDSMFGLKDSIQAIKNLSRTGSALHTFLDRFKHSLLNHYHPGVAVFVAKALKIYAESATRQQANLKDFLNIVVNQVYVYLNNWKPSLRNHDTASLGKIGLLYPESYFPAKPLQVASETPTGRHAVPSFLRMNSFLEFHLYYLRNPQFMDEIRMNDPRNWLFLVVPSRNKNIPPTFGTENKNEPPTLGTLVLGEFSEWINGFTHFEPNDLFTLLGCLFMPYTKSPMALLSRAHSQVSTEKSAANSPNPGSIKLDGNHFEVATAACVVDATQHSNDYRKVPCRDVVTNEPSFTLDQLRSFHGQSGVTFIQNLVGNLVDEQFELNSSNLVKVSFEKSTKFNLVDKFLKNCRIPFLYSINRSFGLFNDLSVLSRKPDRDPGFFVEEYTRTVDNDQIDAKFRIIHDNRPALAVVECKFWRESLAADGVREILKKMRKFENPKLSLVFCNSCTEARSTSSLVDYCKARGERVNIYRVKKVENRNYEIVPFFTNNDDLIFSTPQLICIIFEMKVINPESAPVTVPFASPAPKRELSEKDPALSLEVGVKMMKLS